MRKIYAGIFLVLAAVAAAARAQSPPASDIYLADLLRSGDSLKIVHCRRITENPGYDNQPKFLPDGSGLLFASIREEPQADVFLYDLRLQHERRLTRTPESEFSPTPMPGGGWFSVVRVEKDTTQRLWKFPLAGGAPELLFPEIQPVGYHAWLDSTHAAIFVLGDPIVMVLAERTSGRAVKLFEKIGRSLQKDPRRRAITFVHKRDRKVWWIKSLLFPQLEVVNHIQTLPEAEDFCWTPAREILMGHGSRLYRFRDGGTRWEPVADLSEQGIQHITRLDVSPDGSKIAIVSRQ